MTPADDALRLGAHERVRQAVDSLAHLGPASEIIDRCPEAAAAAADLDRVVLSRIENGTLVVERVHIGGAHPNGVGEQLRRAPLRLSYPLLECELLRRRQARLVADIDRSQPARYAFLETLGWREYVAAPILVDSSGRRASCTATARRAGDRWRSSTPTRWSTSPRASPWCSNAPCCAGACATSAARSAASRRGRRPAPAS